MNSVKIKASFDPSNPKQLAAAVNFLEALGGNLAEEAIPTVENIPVEAEEDLKTISTIIY